MISIYHRRQPTFMANELDTIRTWNADGFDHVANVECKPEAKAQGIEFELEVAFRLTSTVECVWWQRNGEDGLMVIKPHRSTSVGDVARVIAPIKDEYYLCHSMGWKRIELVRPDQSGPIGPDAKPVAGPSD